MNQYGKYHSFADYYSLSMLGPPRGFAELGSIALYFRGAKVNFKELGSKLVILGN